jgi:hypothetical protein
VWSRSGGLIFEGKAAKRKSHKSNPRRRAAETLAADALLAMPIGRYAFIAATVEVIAAHAQLLVVRVLRSDGRPPPRETRFALPDGIGYPATRSVARAMRTSVGLYGWRCCARRFKRTSAPG